MSGISPIPAHAFNVRYRTAPIGRGSSAAEMGGFSFKLLIIFFLLLYSSLPLMFPVLELLRPAQALGGLALIVMLYEKAGARQRLDFAWPDGYLLAGFIATSGLSIFGAVWPGYALEAALTMIKMGVVYLLIVNTVINENKLRTLLWVMVLGGLFPALGSLWYWQQGIRVEGRAAWLGVFANPNEMAYSLVVLIPIAVALSRHLSLARRILVWLVVAVFMTAIYLSYSRGSILGLFAVLAYMGWRQKNKFARAAMIAVLVAGILAVPLYWSRGDGFSNLREDANLHERLTTYKIALAMYADSPLLGVGINCSSVAWPLYAPALQLGNHKWLVTHNTFLQALSETGTLGFLFLVSFFAAVISRAWRAGRSNIPGREGVVELMSALEISFWGFVVCGLSGGYILSWFPYLLAGLIGAAGRIVAEPAQFSRTTCVQSGNGRTAGAMLLPFMRPTDK